MTSSHTAVLKFIFSLPRQGEFCANKLNQWGFSCCACTLNGIDGSGVSHGSVFVVITDIDSGYVGQLFRNMLCVRFAKADTHLLALCVRLVQHNTVWRETTLQHFGGSYADGLYEHKRTDMPCSPIDFTRSRNDVGEGLTYKGHLRSENQQQNVLLSKVRCLELMSKTTPIVIYK